MARKWNSNSEIIAAVRPLRKLSQVLQSRPPNTVGGVKAPFERSSSGIVMESIVEIRKLPSTNAGDEAKSVSLRRPPAAAILGRFSNTMAVAVRRTVLCRMWSIMTRSVLITHQILRCSMFLLTPECLRCLLRGRKRDLRRIGFGLFQSPCYASP
jgi:hypothetical protein